VALQAERLVFLTYVEGVLDGNGKVIEGLGPDATWELLNSGVVAGGMRPKLVACLEALKAGVSQVVIAGPGRHASALAEGIGGTRIANIP
jgi:acetylglutamate kinase